MDILIKIHDQGYAMPSACKIVAQHDQLEILKWLRSKKYPWNEEVCDWATVGEDYNMLQWLHLNGCPWDEKNI